MPVARYPEVLDDLRRKILDGTYPPGQPLPHSDTLAADYGVGTQPITRAMRELAAEGLIWRVANQGMIVQEQVPVVDLALAIPPALDAQQWRDACRRTGLDGDLIETGIHEESATSPIAQALHLDDGAPVLCRIRHATVSGRIVFTDRLHYPRATFQLSPGTEILTSLRASLTAANAAVEIYTATRMPTRDEAKALKIKNVPVLDITRIVYDATGQPVELLRRTVNSLRVRLVEQLSLSDSGKSARPLTC